MVPDDVCVDGSKGVKEQILTVGFLPPRVAVHNISRTAVLIKLAFI